VIFIKLASVVSNLTLVKLIGKKKDFLYFYSITKHRRVHLFKQPYCHTSVNCVVLNAPYVILYIIFYDTLYYTNSY